MKKIIIVGVNGQLATCLRQAPCDWGVMRAIGRPDIDLSEPNGLADSVAALAPDLVINAAAYTAVDNAEREPEIARVLNAVAPDQIAQGAAQAGAPIIHISTDYVFDGTAPRPYRETDPTAPLGVYGRTKREGEQMVAKANGQHIIARTAWVFSAHGANFVKSILRLGAERDSLSVVSDQVGCPTSANDLANALLAIGERICTAPRPDDYGITHICGTGIASWYDVAKAVFALAGGPDPMIIPIETKDYPTLAHRPANSRLDMTRLERHFGIKMPYWHASLAKVLEDLQS